MTAVPGTNGYVRNPLPNDPRLKTNQFDIQYVEPKNPAHKHLYDKLRHVRLLEKLQGFLAPIRLPIRITIKVEGVPCDSPMKLQTVGPPERGSLSVVYSCPECGYEMAMLTNAYETQVVQSLGVRIGPSTELGTGPEARPGASGGKCPFPAMIPGNDGAAGRPPGEPAGPVDVRSRSAAREHSRVRPPDGADRHRAIRPGERGPRSGREDPRRRPRLLRHVGRDMDTTRQTLPSPAARLRPALRRLLEPHLPLQPRLRALLSRRRRRAPGRHRELRRPERARHRGMLQGHRRDRRVRA